MLRKTRIVLASVVFAFVTLMFLDFTGTVHLYFNWMAKIQLVPAILSHSFVIIIVWLLLTLLLGRIYCSVICPLGVMQDCVSHVSGIRKGQKSRFSFSKARSRWRYGIFALYAIALIVGVNIIFSLLDPYSGYGRIATNILAPVYRAGNNVLAAFAETIDSYAFYSTDVWVKSGISLGVAALTLAITGILAWRNGRSYCNIICPVGTFLGLISRFSIYRPVLDTEKCTKCGLCEKGCKASCIDSGNMAIDHSRCVTCFNCIENCKQGAISYSSGLNKKSAKQQSDAPDAPNATDETNGMSRRNVLAIAWAMAVAETTKAPLLQVDGGLAEIKDKKIPTRKLPIIPPGAQSLHNIKRHCSACQLCVSSCPNGVLRPSSKLDTLMQPEMSFERGYCRPECTECGDVCPTNAIGSVTKAQKTSISIAYAVFVKENCIVTKDNVQCRSCERHCPTEAIMLVDREPGNPESLKIPTINNEKCNGCGACEYYCPARPFSAIFLEGHVRHHSI